MADQSSDSPLNEGGEEPTDKDIGSIEQQDVTVDGVDERQITDSWRAANAVMHAHITDHNESAYSEALQVRNFWDAEFRRLIKARESVQ